MFGEQLIIGHSESKLDQKGRLFIPKYTKVNTGEELILLQDSIYHYSSLRVYSLNNTYLKIINKYEELRNNASNEEEYIRLSLKIDELYQSLEGYFKVDSQKRILINKYLLERLNWNTTDTFNLDGAGNSLLIRKKQS